MLILQFVMWSVLFAADPEVTVKAVKLRKFGQEIIQTLGGRRIHPVFAVPGGVNKSLHTRRTGCNSKDLDESIRTIEAGLAIMKGWVEKNAEDINKFGVFDTGYFGMVTPDNGLELYEGKIRLIDREGKQLECFDPKQLPGLHCRAC